MDADTRNQKSGFTFRASKPVLVISLITLQVELDGLTGKLKFDQQGLRTGFYLSIIELKKSGLTQVNVYFICGS